ncbi:MAG: leucine-rich repeat protein [Clostridia bacterium]|nr:leucine-rich repeat protein [Clostridia bacterium]
MEIIKKFEPIFGEWSVESFIGAGSFGRVYKIYREENGQRFYSALKYYSIPDSVTNIGDYAFYYCDSLTSITFEGTPPTVGENVSESDITLYYPAAYAHLWVPNGETEWNGYRIEQLG